MNIILSQRATIFRKVVADLYHIFSFESEKDYVLEIDNDMFNDVSAMRFEVDSVCSLVIAYLVYNENMQQIQFHISRYGVPVISREFPLTELDKVARALILEVEAQVNKKD